SLLQIGKPAVRPLVDAMQRKNAALEADAKKYEFRPGVIVQKTALVLGDLRAREAVPALVQQLGQPSVGDADRGVLYALGMIADPSTLKEITQVLGDGKRDYKDRIAAAEALNLAGDTQALGALLSVAKSEGGKKKIAGPAATAAGSANDLRVAAAIAYSRL